jgi:hypothetical protein
MFHVRRLILGAASGTLAASVARVVTPRRAHQREVHEGPPERPALTLQSRLHGQVTAAHVLARIVLHLPAALRSRG